MNIAIIGFGLEGQAAYDYWKDGNQITVCDMNEALKVPAGVSAQLGADYLHDLDQFDLIVRSPHVHPRLIQQANSEAIFAKVTSNTNEFLRASPTRNIIGVTGTKGKGTTSSLIAAMLTAAGKKVYLGGNIGVPALHLLKADIQPDDWVVLELSSFQLIDCKLSPHIAVCLMFVSEHLDWHPDIDEYERAKQQLFRWQKPDDIAIYFASSSKSAEIAGVSQGTKLPYFEAPGAVVEAGVIRINNEPIVRVDELQLLGAHNWQNICAALTAVWQVTQDVAALRTGITSFSGLEHRLEFVRELDGVRYYDDSFGTTPETAIVALQAFAQPKVIILGGSDKGADYTELAKTVAASNVRQVLLIGEQAKRIEDALQTAGFNKYTQGGITMEEIVGTARYSAKSGDIVLLSTGCASFDMFENYKDRGNQFSQAVQALV